MSASMDCPYVDRDTETTAKYEKFFVKSKTEIATIFVGKKLKLAKTLVKKGLAGVRISPVKSANMIEIVHIPRKNKPKARFEKFYVKNANYIITIFLAKTRAVTKALVSKGGGFVGIK